MTRRIIPDFTKEGKSHADQLRAFADDCLRMIRNHFDDPRTATLYMALYDAISKQLKAGDELPTDPIKPNQSADALASLDTETLLRLAESQK